MADDDKSGVASAAAPLAVGLVTLTTVLTAVGGLTGGLARMFRNYGEPPSWWPEALPDVPEATMPFLLVLLAVLASVFATLARGSSRVGGIGGKGGAGAPGEAGGPGGTGGEGAAGGAGGDGGPAVLNSSGAVTKQAGAGGPGGQGGRGASGGAGGAGGPGSAGTTGGAGGAGGTGGAPGNAPGLAMPGILVSVGGLLFVLGILWAIALMVDTTGEDDRPSLSASVVQASSGTWSLKGTARSSGLETSQKMQVYVYALPRNASECGEQAGEGSCGRRLFYVSTGPDQDGVATEAFEIPLPPSKGLSAFVVTANLGAVPLDCDNQPIAVGNHAESLVPPATDHEADSERACMVFNPPPRPEPPSAQTEGGKGSGG